MENKRYAHVVAGVAVNVIVWDGVSGEADPREPADGIELDRWVSFSEALGGTLVEVPDGTEVGEGYGYDGSGFIAPAAPEAPGAPVPKQVTMRQARLALLDAGKLDAIKEAIAALPGPEGDAARIEWEFAATVDRGSPMVAMLSRLVDLDDAALDQLFTDASTR